VPVIKADHAIDRSQMISYLAGHFGIVEDHPG
jgi:hypothetical protein